MEWFANDSPGLEHFWHPVALAREVSAGTPTRVELLGQRWMLIRIDGRVLAFQDECPHRRASLSGGRVVDDTIECPYHGWRYDWGGQCVKVPALPPDAAPPARAQLSRPHGVAEYAGVVWMAIEEPVEQIIAWPQWDTPGWDAWWLEPRTTHVSGGLLTENFMDATHFAFVHRDTFGAKSPSTGVEHSERAGWRLSAGYDQITYQPGLGTVAARVTGDLQGPLCFRLLIAAAGGSRAFTFFLQPCNGRETRLYLGVACDDTAGDPERMAAESVFNNRVYDEDLVVLENYADSRLPLDLTVEVSTPADKHLIKYRRLLADVRRLAG